MARLAEKVRITAGNGIGRPCPRLMVTMNECDDGSQIVKPREAKPREACAA